ncbi:hypothetical protein [Chishuiella sp.]|uniref:hypothetical protein n=1 Tax=Chishuiella sp. TaxID=1969467 RepID=UPI0028A5AD87|nr:hypothetical protein [Chishuiella sp.]
MNIAQEKIDFALSQIENHLKDLGIKNNFSFLRIEESDDENEKIFFYEVSTPNFKTIIQISYNFMKEEQNHSSDPSFSWMDYKKITE